MIQFLLIFSTELSATTRLKTSKKLMMTQEQLLSLMTSI